ncbi:competence protein CoiA family protein [Aromatoleum evansii]|uniref:Competence protein CoiA family protein n=1 Tax=Aromatoleum evansii TaxID=59406 RepID=A0ABZ1AMM5_AROEV|nr:competence protein CoiA family protein [Aromatoleum evansii]
MESLSLLQSFAMDKNGRIRSVEEVSRGLACDCVCPCCGEPVLARQGDVREWHFAHASGAECDGGAEGALHAAAKQVLIESGGMAIPERRVSTKATLPDGRQGTGDAVRPEAWIEFATIEAEKKVGELRPDIVATVGTEVLFVEVAVTHFVDDDKSQKLESLGFPTIEIDLAKMHREKWAWEDVFEVVVEGVQAKRWIRLMDASPLHDEAHYAAMQAALALPAPTPVEASPQKAPRTRFLIGGRIVDLIEHPFGIALWSSYDPSVNAVIKSLMRIVGGRWQPRFKNWLAPTAARDYLFEELAKLSTTSPARV